MLAVRFRAQFCCLYDLTLHFAGTRAYRHSGQSVRR